MAGVKVAVDGLALLAATGKVEDTGLDEWLKSTSGLTYVLFVERGIGEASVCHGTLSSL